MADSKITALTALTSADPANDMIPIVDVSDTPPASGNTKRISINNILAASGTATLASATITGAATVGTTLGVTGVSTFAAGTALLPALTTTGDTNTGIYYPAADTFAVTTGGTESHRANSTGLIRGATTADIVSVETTTLTNIGNIGASYGASTGTYFVAKVNAENGIVELKADARSGNYPPMVFTTSATQRMQIDAAGQLGIGVTPSAWSNPYKCVQLSGGSLSVYPTTDLYISQNAYNSGGWKRVAAGYASQYIQTNSEHRFLIAGTDPTVGSAITFTQAMTIDASGNLILLSSNTPATLATNGQLTVNATSNTNLRFSYRGSDGTTRVANITLA